jgi:hypothetical protein
MAISRDRDDFATTFWTVGADVFGNLGPHVDPVDTRDQRESNRRQ